jgi:HK97 gp10 family phage protein
MARSVIGGNQNSISADVRKGFRIDGLKDIQDRLARIVSNVTGREMKAVYVEAAGIVADDIRARAPEDTGLLKRAIFVGSGDLNKPNALVGVGYRKAPHAHLVEYGTVKMAARPFVRPALSANGPQVAEFIRAGLLKIIDRHTV